MFEFNRAPVVMTLSLLMVLTTVFYGAFITENQLLMASDKTLLLSSSMPPSIHIGGSSSASSPSSPIRLSAADTCPTPLIPSGHTIRSLFLPAFSVMSAAQSYDNALYEWLDSLLSLGRGRHERREAGVGGCDRVHSDIVDWVYGRNRNRSGGNAASTEEDEGAQGTGTSTSVWSWIVHIFVSVTYPLAKTVYYLARLFIVFPIKYMVSCLIALTPAELFLTLFLLMGSGAALEARLGSLRLLSLITLVGILGGLLYLGVVAYVAVTAHILGGASFFAAAAGGSGDGCGGSSSPAALWFTTVLGFGFGGSSSSASSPSWLFTITAQLSRYVVDISSLVEVYYQQQQTPSSCAGSGAEAPYVLTSQWLLVPTTAPLALILHWVYRLLTVTVVAVEVADKRKGGYESAATNNTASSGSSGGAGTPHKGGGRLPLAPPQQSAGSVVGGNGLNSSVVLNHSSSGTMSRRSSPCVPSAVGGANGGLHHHHHASSSPMAGVRSSSPSSALSASALSGGSAAVVVAPPRTHTRIMYSGAVRSYKLLGFIPLVDATVGNNSVHPIYQEATAVPLRQSEVDGPPAAEGSSLHNSVGAAAAASLPPPPPSRPNAASASSDSETDSDAEDAREVAEGGAEWAPERRRPFFLMFGAGSLSTTFLCDFVALQLWIISSTNSCGWVDVSSSTSSTSSWEGSPVASFHGFLGYVFVTMPLRAMMVPLSSRMMACMWSVFVLSHVCTSSIFAKTAVGVIEKAIRQRRDRVQKGGAEAAAASAMLLDSRRRPFLGAIGGKLSSLVSGASGRLSAAGAAVKGVVAYVLAGGGRVAPRKGMGRNAAFERVPTGTSVVDGGHTASSSDGASLSTEMAVVASRGTSPRVLVDGGVTDQQALSSASSFHRCTDGSGSHDASTSTTTPIAFVPRLESLALHQLPEDLLLSAVISATRVMRRASRRREERRTRRRWLKWQRANADAIKNGAVAVTIDASGTAAAEGSDQPNVANTTAHPFPPRSSRERRAARRLRRRLLEAESSANGGLLAKATVLLAWVVYGLMRIFMVPSESISNANAARRGGGGGGGGTVTAGVEESSPPMASPTGLLSTSSTPSPLSNAADLRRHRFTRPYRLRPFLESSVSSDFLGLIRSLAQFLKARFVALGAAVMASEERGRAATAALLLEHRLYMNDVRSGAVDSDMEDGDMDSDAEEESTDARELDFDGGYDPYSDSDFDDDEGQQTAGDAAATHPSNSSGGGARRHIGVWAARAARAGGGPMENMNAANARAEARRRQQQQGGGGGGGDPSASSPRSVHPLRGGILYLRHRPETVTVTFVADALVRTTSAAASSDQSNQLHHHVGAYYAADGGGSTAPYPPTPRRMGGGGGRNDDDDEGDVSPISSLNSSLSMDSPSTAAAPSREEGAAAGVGVRRRPPASSSSSRPPAATAPAATVTARSADVETLMSLMSVDEATAVGALRRGGGTMEGAVHVLLDG